MGAFVAIAGCERPELVVEDTGPVYPLDERHVYWRDLTENVIERCPRSGCTGAPEVIATDVRGVYTAGLAVDDAHVYWTSQTGLYRRRK